MESLRELSYRGRIKLIADFVGKCLDNYENSLVTELAKDVSSENLWRLIGALKALNNLRHAVTGHLVSLTLADLSEPQDVLLEKLGVETDEDAYEAALELLSLHANDISSYREILQTSTAHVGQLHEIQGYVRFMLAVKDRKTPHEVVSEVIS